MRLAWSIGLIMTATTGAALAQGTRDPANFGTVSNAKPQTTNLPSSRPTAIQNTPPNALPPGVALQRVYRDGKLQTIVR